MERLRKGKAFRGTYKHVYLYLVIPLEGVGFVVSGKRNRAEGSAAAAAAAATATRNPLPSLIRQKCEASEE